jgi:hypothetical protein
MSVFTGTMYGQLYRKRYFTTILFYTFMLPFHYRTTLTFLCNVRLCLRGEIHNCYVGCAHVACVQCVVTDEGYGFCMLCVVLSQLRYAVSGLLVMVRVALNCIMTEDS